MDNGVVAAGELVMRVSEAEQRYLIIGGCPHK